MLTKSDTRKEQQGDLFKPLLRDIVSPHHAMVKLADAIDWQSFEDGLSASFCANNGRPSLSSSPDGRAALSEIRERHE